MKFGAFGPRFTKLYIKICIVSAVAFLLWWGSATILSKFNYEEYSFWLSLPFWIIGAMVILSLYGIGGLRKKIDNAIIEDYKEEKENMKSKQPWEG